MKLLLVFLLLLLLPSVSPAQRDGCACRTISADQEPLGGNEIVTAIERKPINRIRGRVFYTRYLPATEERPISEAIVEVFDHPESDKIEPYQVPGQRKRRASCMTGENGKFCFAALPTGRYLLRVGTSNRDIEHFNHQLIVVTVAAKRKSSDKEIEVRLTPAT